MTGDPVLVLVPVPGGGNEQIVEFAVAYPDDLHEQLLRLLISRPAWESQGSPPELHLAMTAPQPEEPS